MRYFIAIMVAGVLIGSISLYMNQVARSIQQRIQQRMAEAKPSSDSPSDQSGEQGDFGMEVTASEMTQIQIVEMWMISRFLLIPAILVCSLEVARRLGDRSHVHTRSED